MNVPIYHVVPNAKSSYTVTSLDGEVLATVWANTLLQVSVPGLKDGQYIIWPVDGGSPVMLRLTGEREKLEPAPLNTPFPSHPVG